MTEGVFSSTIRRATLNLLSEDPVYDYTDQFQLPTNPKCLRVIDTNLEPGQRFVIEGDKLLCDNSTINIRYIAYLTDSDDYDEMLKKCIIARLAAELAYPLTGSASNAQAMFQRYQAEMANALAVDGQNGSNQVINMSAFTEIR